MAVPRGEAQIGKVSIDILPFQCRGSGREQFLRSVIVDENATGAVDAEDRGRAAFDKELKLLLRIAAIANLLLELFEVPDGLAPPVSQFGNE
jgi:hypothetical protein